MIELLLVGGVASYAAILTSEQWWIDLLDKYNIGKPFTCEKCLAFWGTLIVGLFMDITILHLLLMAPISGVISNILYKKLMTF